MAVDCLKISERTIMDILHEMLYEFPVREVSVRVSEWIDELPGDYWLRKNTRPLFTRFSRN